MLINDLNFCSLFYQVILGSLNTNTWIYPHPGIVGSFEYVQWRRREGSLYRHCLPLTHQVKVDRWCYRHYKIEYKEFTNKRTTHLFRDYKLLDNLNMVNNFLQMIIFLKRCRRLLVPEQEDFNSPKNRKYLTRPSV